MPMLSIRTLIVGAFALAPLAAFAQDDAFTRYEKLALRVAADAAVASPDIATLAARNERLATQGRALMAEYARAYAECDAQYRAFAAAIDSGSLEGASVDRLETGFHDGEELPAAAGHCYFGRALLVHPLMNAARLDGGLDASEVRAFVHESEEVAEHAITAKERIAKAGQ